VAARGQAIAGSLLRGVLDADLVRLVVTPTGTAGTYSIGLTVTDPTAAAAGLVHGGRLEPFVQQVASVPALSWEAIAAGRPVTAVTVLSGSSAGVTAVVDDTGVVGDERLAQLGAGAVIEHHAGLVGATARRRTVEVKGERLLIEVLLPVVALGIVGTGELAEALGAQAELRCAEASGSSVRSGHDAPRQHAPSGSRPPGSPRSSSAKSTGRWASTWARPAPPRRRRPSPPRSSFTDPRAPDSRSEPRRDRSTDDSSDEPGLGEGRVRVAVEALAGRDAEVALQDELFVEVAG
jgi:hypothetical protein